MQTYVKIARVKRYAAFGLGATVVGLGLMVAAIVLAFIRKEEMTLVITISFSGLIVSQLGMTLRNRWGIHPRIDETLDDALKGLDNRFSIFHYVLGASHALVCPSGVFAVCTSEIDGEITYGQGSWLNSGPKRRLFRRSGTQRLSEPSRQTDSEVRLLGRALHRHLKADDELPIRPILVFIHPGAMVRAENAPFPAVHIKKLKGFLRSLPKGQTLSAEKVESLASAVGV